MKLSCPLTILLVVGVSFLGYADASLSSHENNRRRGPRLRRAKLQDIRDLKSGDDDDDGGRDYDSACGDEGKGKGGKGGGSNSGSSSLDNCDTNNSQPDQPNPTSPPSSDKKISGFVQVDENNDGFGDRASQGVTVQLYAFDGTTLVATAVSDVNGAFTFPVPPGRYILRQPTNPPDAILDVSGPANPIALTIYQDITGLTFINEPTRTISGEVLIDEDGDGKGDIPAPGARVQLLSPTEEVMETVTTGPDGKYEFEVPPGMYRVREFENPPNAALDVSENLMVVDVSSGDSTGNDFIDEAEEPALYMLTGVVQLDTDNDDIPNKVMGGSTVKLTTLNGAPVGETIVGPSGKFAFEVGPGQYILEEINPPDHIDVTPSTINVVITDGDSTDNEFVNEPKRTISGFARVDTNNDKIGDKAIPGHLIILKQGDKEIQSTVTGPAGFYSFQVPPGVYVVEEPTNPLDAPTDVTENMIEVDVTAGNSKQNNFVDAPKAADKAPCKNTEPDVRGAKEDEGCSSSTPLCVDADGDAIAKGAEGEQCVACGEKKDIDVCIVLDESGSISDEEWKQQVEFTNRLIDGIDAAFSKNADFDLSVFSTTARLIDSNLEAADVKAEVTNHDPAGGFTATGAGIRTCVTASGGGPLIDQPDDNMFLLLITDGKPNRPKNSGVQDAVDAANNAKGRGVTLVPIGVGKVEIGQVLDQLASPGYAGIRATDFTDLQQSDQLLQKIIDSVTSKCI